MPVILQELLKVWRNTVRTRRQIDCRHLRIFLSKKKRVNTSEICDEKSTKKERKNHIEKLWFRIGGKYTQDPYQVSRRWSKALQAHSHTKRQWRKQKQKQETPRTYWNPLNQKQWWEIRNMTYLHNTADFSTIRPEAPRLVQKQSTNNIDTTNPLKRSQKRTRVVSLTVSSRCVFLVPKRTRTTNTSVRNRDSL